MFYWLVRWFTRDWWDYLLDDCSGVENFFCRIDFHSCGVVWYNFDPNRLEPDMRCKNCGEDLG
jgi:hypothetical protein